MAFCHKHQGVLVALNLLSSYVNLGFWYSRIVTTDTAQLRAKIVEMGNRIRQLENALAIFQAGISNELHPLLQDELLAIKFAPAKGHMPGKEESLDGTADTIDAFGILTIGDQGAKYYGPSAGSEVRSLSTEDTYVSNSFLSRRCSWYAFMLAQMNEVNKYSGQAGSEMDMSALEHDKTPRVSAEITGLSRFPFGFEEPTRARLELILGYLPPQPRAWSLYETYMEHSSWIFRPLKRDEMIDEILSPIYKYMKDKQTFGSSAIESISPHKLAVLFLVFTLGALLDLTLEPCKFSYCLSMYYIILVFTLDNTEFETYYHLGCACLSLRSVFDSPELATVQAVLLMAACHAEGGKNNTMDSAVSDQSIGVEPCVIFPLSGL
jgi:hypothetical protein